MRHGRRRIDWAVGAVCLFALVCASASGAAASAPPRPVFAKTVRLEPVSGTVLILVPGAYAYVRLTISRDVPVGTLVDATAGRVELTSASPATRKLQSGQFFLGIFRVQQNRAAGGLVNLIIHDNLTRSVCGASAAHAATLNKRVLGLLKASAKGHFQTTGRFAAATVRGTRWGVRDRCDGTLTVVERGVVVVRNFVLHKTVIVRTGQTYLAKAP